VKPTLRRRKQGKKSNPEILLLVTTRDTPKYIPKGAVKGVQGLICGKAAAAIFNSISI
jgi:hypothetical protein